MQILLFMNRANILWEIMGKNLSAKWMKPAKNIPNSILKQLKDTQIWQRGRERKNKKITKPTIWVLVI